jgi:MFS family permease
VNRPKTPRARPPGEEKEPAASGQTSGGPAPGSPDDQPPPAAPKKGHGSPDKGITLRQYAILVGAGAFATTFAQQRVLGNYPTTFLLKDHLHLAKEQVAVFFFWATFAWNLKPLAGILTDAFPLFGTRRRSYMILGALTAGILWLVMGLYPGNYTSLLLASAGMNIAMVFASTVMGGLMVEAGQAFGASGRIASLRQTVQSVAGIGAPLLGGYLAGQAFGWKVTTSLAAGTVLALAVLVFFVLKEKPVPRVTSATNPVPEGPRYRPSPRFIGGLLVGAGLATWMCWRPEFRNMGISLYAFLATFVLIIGIAMLRSANPVIIRAQGQLIQIMRSHTLWLAVGMLFLVYTVPGLNTALIYRQEDVLHFSKQFIGGMSSLEGVFGVLGALAYGLFCRKLNLRILLVGGIGLNAVFTLLYLYYTKGTAPFVHSIGGFVVVLSELALMDLAVRSTPAGCEALGFSLMMSVRNFGIAMSDVIGTKMMDRFHVNFSSLVLINAATTAVILLFVPLLPRAVMSRREGETHQTAKS